MTYADQSAVTTLTQSVSTSMNDSESYNQLLNLALTHADNKVNSTLRRNMIPIDSQNNPNLASNQNIQDAANLYAAAFLINTFYSDNDTASPTATSYTKDADSFLDDYVNNWYAKRADDGYSRSKSPRKATFLRGIHKRSCRRRHRDEWF